MLCGTVVMLGTGNTVGTVAGGNVGVMVSVDFEGLLEGLSVTSLGGA